MFHALFTLYQQNLKMMLDTSQVLSYRLPLLYSTSPNSNTVLDIDNWLEVWKISQEKLAAYQKAFWIFQTETAKINRSGGSAIKHITRDKKPVALISKSVSDNAKDLGNSSKKLEEKTSKSQYSLL